MVHEEPRTGPLVRFPLAASTDPEEFAEFLNRVFQPLIVRPLCDGRSRALSILRGLSEPQFTIGYVRAGLPVALTPPPGRGSYHVNVAVSGGVHSSYGAEETLMRPGRGAVFNAGQAHVLRPLSDRAETIGLKLDRDLVEGELGAMLGRPVERPIRFSLGFDLVEPAGAAWQNMLSTLLAELDRPFGLLDQPRMRLHYVRTLVSGLLTAHSHDYSEELWTPGPRLRPRTVRAAIEFIETHLDIPLTLTDIAAASGCSARSLQQSFRQHVGLTPMGYLRDLRLQRVHAELRSGADGVTAVAYRWGFTHLGRFSSAYRRRFGELPSTTAARAG